MSITPIIAKSGGEQRDFELLPAGSYLARCYRVVDLGTHTEVYPNQKFAAKPARKVMIYLEVLSDYDTDEDIRMEDGRPFSISKKYTLSLNEKATLRKDLEKWRGVKFTKEEAEAFDITKVLGKMALIQVTHVASADGDKTYVNLDALMSTKKVSEGVNELGAFSVDSPDMDMFSSFSKYTQDKINESEELSSKPLIASERPQTPVANAPVANPAVGSAKKAPVTVDEAMNQAGL